VKQARTLMNTLQYSLAGLVLHGVASQGQADEIATITIEVDGAPAVVIEQEALDESNGFFLFLGEYADPDGEWNASWNYWVNPNPLDDAAFLGNAKIKNTSDDESDFVFTIELPLCPAIEDESLLGAFVVVTVQTNEGGGQMSDFDDGAVWAVLADGEVARTIFDPPFLLGSSGQGTASLTSTFGSPFPSEPGVPFESTAGFRHQFSMTDGEKATINTSLYIGGPEENLEPCDGSGYPTGDLNMDGVVNGTDMMLLVQEWGPCPGCAADLNEDEVVNGIDLGILLSNWLDPVGLMPR